MKKIRTLSGVMIIAITLSLFTAMPVSANGGSSELLRITTLELQYPTVSQPYSSPPMTAAGGTAPYTWSATGLPVGLVIDPVSGIISGTPSVQRYGLYSANITVTDVNYMTLTKSYVMELLAANSDLRIPYAYTTFPIATRNHFYSCNLLAAGGTAPYTWSATGLPTGFAINTETGVISGTYTGLMEAFDVTLTVTDANNASASKSIILQMAPDYVRIITDGMNWVALPTGMVGVPYSVTVVADYGVKPYTWSAKNLPAGLTIDSTTGTISGTPTVAVPYTYVTVTATQSGSVSSSVLFYFTIDPGNQPAPTGLAGVAPTTYSGTDGSITGTTAMMEYKLSTDSTYIAVTGTEITGLAAGTYDVRYAAKTGYNAGADAVVILVVGPNADQAAPIGLEGVAPTTYSGTDGSITGTTAMMEYKLSTDSTYIAVTGTEITGLAAGTYDVRYAAKIGFNASPDTSVTVPDGNVILEPIDQIISAVYDAIESGQLKANGGSNSLSAFVARLGDAKAAIEAGDKKIAINILKSIYKQADGKPSPRDIVVGADEIAPMILNLINTLK